MRKNQHTTPRDDHHDFWEQIWAAYRQQTASQQEVQTKHTATATNYASTVWSTAYVTVQVPLSTRLRTTSPSTFSSSDSPKATWVATSSHDTQPTDSTASSSLVTGNAAVSEAPNAGTTMGAIAHSTRPGQKRAIIGGLSGTIAGLVAIGLIICLLLQRRRKQKEARYDFEASMNGGGCPEPAEKSTGLVTVRPAGKGSPRSSHIRPPSMAQIAVDEDHRIIRMSTKHWPRPYAFEGEGYRESVPSGQLRVVNPDPSRPTTPKRLSTETAGSYFRMSALAGFVFNMPRSARQSRTEQTTRIRNTPTITIVDPSLSRECVLTTPSFRSYPSLNTSPAVRQHPPEDPFLTPVQDWNKELKDNTLTAPVTAPQRPSVSPIQNAAGSASKTLTHLGNTLLQPFRAKSHTRPAPAVPQKDARLSTSTYCCSRMSRRSDPFDLDRASIRESHNMAEGTHEWRSGPGDGRLSLYEGT